ncbi:hypothetical protein CY35_06G070900 [Sphagnum magellanicum]|nr:hypothetical protein CY35_06G070900 [Sphagnum magellanicum]
MEGSSPVFGSGVGEEEEEYAAAVQGRSSSGGSTHEGSVSQLLSQVQQQSPERDNTLEEEEEEEGNSYQEAAKTDDSSLGGDGGGAEAHEGFTFDTNLASMHTYLGEVDDVGSSHSSAQGGSMVTLPMFYLEGIVLFPEEKLPLRVLQPRFKAAVVRAMQQEDNEAPNTLGVIHVRAKPQDRGIIVASVGTTAEIRQLGYHSDGSVNIVTKGRQRFQIWRAWTEPDGALFARVQIIEEDTLMRIPRDAFGSLACVPERKSGKANRTVISSPEADYWTDNDSESGSHDDILEDVESTEDERIAMQFASENDELLQALEEDNDSSDEASMGHRRRVRPRLNPASPQREGPKDINHATLVINGLVTHPHRPPDGVWGNAHMAWRKDARKSVLRAQRSAWPQWVYRQYDAYDLARRAADMLRQMADLPSMEALVQMPIPLSYYIASKLPLQDCTRQELLETEGTVNRLKREIQLLEGMDKLKCNRCRELIARRSDMLVMSSDGPISAYVNAHGYVHETLTLSNAYGLFEDGDAQTENSWFPGYAWVLAKCNTCRATGFEQHMGWRFVAIDSKTRPKSFWGIRRTQLIGSHSQQ